MSLPVREQIPGIESSIFNLTAPKFKKAVATTPSITMYVVKRNGKQEKVSFDKITSRIAKLCYGLDKGKWHDETHNICVWRACKKKWPHLVAPFPDKNFSLHSVSPNISTMTLAAKSARRTRQQTSSNPSSSVKKLYKESFPV